MNQIGVLQNMMRQKDVRINELEGNVISLTDKIGILEQQVTNHAGLPAFLTRQQQAARAENQTLK